MKIATADLSIKLLPINDKNKLAEIDFKNIIKINFLDVKVCDNEFLIVHQGTLRRLLNNDILNIAAVLYKVKISHSSSQNNQKYNFIQTAEQQIQPQDIWQHKELTNNKSIKTVSDPLADGEIHSHQHITTKQIDIPKQIQNSLAHDPLQFLYGQDNSICNQLSKIDPALMGLPCVDTQTNYIPAKTLPAPKQRQQAMQGNVLNDLGIVESLSLITNRAHTCAKTSIAELSPMDMLDQFMLDHDNLSFIPTENILIQQNQKKKVKFKLRSLRNLFNTFNLNPTSTVDSRFKHGGYKQ